MYIALFPFWWEGGGVYGVIIPAPFFPFNPLFAETICPKPQPREEETKPPPPPLRDSKEIFGCREGLGGGDYDHEAAMGEGGEPYGTRGTHYKPPTTMQSSKGNRNLSIYRGNCLPQINRQLRPGMRGKRKPRSPPSRRSVFFSLGMLRFSRSVPRPKKSKSMI